MASLVLPQNLKWINKVIGSSSGGPGGGSAGPVDLVFAIDTTGSMAPYIDSAVSSAAATVDALSAQQVLTFESGVVDFQDSDFGCSNYDSVLDLNFTLDKSAILSALQSLPSKVQGGGCDAPEDMYSGIDRALSLSWRPGVTKAVIVLSDAPGHDPEPHTGFTLASITAHAQAVDPAQVYAILVGQRPGRARLPVCDRDCRHRRTDFRRDREPRPTQDPRLSRPSSRSRARARRDEDDAGGHANTGRHGNADHSERAIVAPVPSLGEGTMTFQDGGQAIAVCSDLPVSTSGAASCTFTPASGGQYARRRPSLVTTNFYRRRLAPRR